MNMQRAGCAEIVSCEQISSYPGALDWSMLDFLHD